MQRTNAAMDTPTVLSNELISVMSTLIDVGKYNEALQLTDDNKYSGVLKDNCWDLIPFILKQVNDDIIITKPSLQHFCEQVLLMIVKRSNPEEVLLELIEQIEVAKNDAQFLIVLKPLNNILAKLTVKRGRSMEWCLNTIHSYIVALPAPEEHILEKEEMKLLDSDTNVRRILKVYSQLPCFYRSFITEVSCDAKYKHLNDELLGFLISLLGEQFIYLHFEEDGNTKSEVFICAETIIGDIVKCGIDILKFLKYAEGRCVADVSQCDDDEIRENDPIDIFLQPEKLTLFSLGGLFYTSLACGLKMPTGAISQVYSPEYLLHGILHPCISLLETGKTIPVLKGLKLSKTVVNKLQENSSRSLLDNRVHSSFCKSIIKVAIFCPCEHARKEAVMLLNKYIKKFDMDSRSILIEHLIKAANHSGLIGYLITMFKDFLAEGLNSDLPLPEPLNGKRLSRVLDIFCTLPHGAESDIVELADQIIATLNLLRFLALRDLKNLTGIRDRFSHLEKTYIDPLREGLKLSKAHYKLKLKEIKEWKNENIFGEITLNVGGTTVDSIPLESKRDIVISALNAFHLIEGLLARFEECIILNRQS